MKLMDEPRVDRLKIKIFSDGSDLSDIKKYAADPRIKGFTTNPTLMWAAGVNDYKAFALDVLRSSRIAPCRSRFSPTTFPPCRIKRGR